MNRLHELNERWQVAAGFVKGVVLLCQHRQRIVVVFVNSELVFHDFLISFASPFKTIFSPFAIQVYSHLIIFLAETI